MNKQQLPHLEDDHPAWLYLRTPGISDVAAALVYLGDLIAGLHEGDRLEAQQQLEAVKAEAKIPGKGKISKAQK